MNLVKWDKIRTAIAECDDISELSEMSYGLEAIQHWAKQSKESLEAQNKIAEYRLHLDRKRGQWIENNIPKTGGGDPTGRFGPVTPTLKEAGIGHHESPKLRAMASVPEQVFEQHIAEVKADGEKELTSAGILRLAKIAQQVEVTTFSSESNEYYTPAIYVEASRELMGGIDLDPASCLHAQKVIEFAI